MSIHADTADVLDAAADHIEKHGWWHPTAPREGDRPACASNAIAWSSGQHYHAAHRALADTLAADPNDLAAIFDWNDGPDRTEQEVLDTLRYLAKSERRLDDEATP